MNRCIRECDAFGMVGAACVVDWRVPVVLVWKHGEMIVRLSSSQVNPGIIGGLVVDIGDRHVDLSLNNQIRKMEALLLESVSLDK